MRSLILIALTVLVVGLGFWSYQENYKTRDAMDRVAALRLELGQTHAWLAKLNAEWAYQNRPDRLRSLAELNYDRLGLLPFMPEAFGDVSDVAYPPEKSPTSDETLEALLGDPSGEKPL